MGMLYGYEYAVVWVCCCMGMLVWVCWYGYALRCGYVVWVCCMGMLLYGYAGMSMLLYEYVVRSERSSYLFGAC